MTNISGNSIGVDISKNTLDCYRWETKEYRQFLNTHLGIQELIEWVKEGAPLKHVVFEASGGYEDPLKEALLVGGLAFWLVDPRLIRYFIKSEGIRAKTDKIDAKMIAQFGSRKQANYIPICRSAQESKLYILVERRRQLVEIKQTESTRLKKPKLLGALQSIRDHITYLDNQIKQLDKEIDVLCSSTPTMKAEIEILQSVPGVGLVSAASLLSFLPELGHIGKKQINALVGVAPFSRQSGQYRGIERINGGRFHPRRVLYMCVLVGIRHNSVIRSYYEMLCSKGKPKKVAIVACMRKLIVILNTMLMKHQKWGEQSKKGMASAPIDSAVASHPFF